MKPTIAFSFLTLIVCVISSANAQTEISAEHEKFFESKIRPALVKYCYECHSIETGKTRGGLLVDTRDALLQGGDSGPAISSNEPSENVLWSAITWEDYEMPPREKMPDSVIEDFRKWIEMGSPDPRVRKKVVVKSKMDIEKGKEHWAFQKPKTDLTASIDNLVAKKLEEHNLAQQSPAQPTTLLRRLYFDLIGLPPKTSEIKQFLERYKKDPTKAVEYTVDELLNRPQYGERWGRHWLDVVRFAESAGNTNAVFPTAWRYRDYVIDSFNNDVPYDRFVTEQLAGDLLPAKTDEIWQEHLIATGFLAVGVKRLNERNPRQFQMDLVDEQIDTMSQAFLGLTISCARCHDHKFDPIPTTDYYAMAGIFMSTDTFYGTKSGLQNRRPSNLLLLPIEDKNRNFLRLQKKRSKICENVFQRFVRSYDKFAQKHLEAKRSSNAILLFGVAKSLVWKACWTTLMHPVIRKRLEWAFKMQSGWSMRMCFCVAMLNRQRNRLGAGSFKCLMMFPSRKIKSKSSGRRELAEWITNKDNPLTARVMVNRIWMLMTGKPIVATPNNWGTTSIAPTNPELLDYLATRFMSNDWSIKSMVPRNCLSKTYQQATTYNKRFYTADPDNKFNWRANPRQLDAESLRDSMLACCMNLDLERPDSKVAAVADTNVGRFFDSSMLSKTDNHRSVYLPIFRDSLPESLELFDFADPAAANPGRESTNVPSQSLYLINNEWVTHQAQQMALKLTKEFETLNEQVRFAFLQMYGRPASKSEIAASVKFFKEFQPLAKNVGSNFEIRRQQARNQFRNMTPEQRERFGNQMRARGGKEGRRGMRGGSGGTAGGMRGGALRGGGMASGGVRPGMQNIGEELPVLKLNAQQQTLAVFLQSLMASAEFRILD